MQNRMSGIVAPFLAITHLEITSKQPYGSFRTGDYVIWQGKVHGDLAPQEPIPGLDKASRNARGRIDYSARIVLIMPDGTGRGNGTLLVTNGVSLISNI